MKSILLLVFASTLLFPAFSQDLKKQVDEKAKDIEEQVVAWR